MQPIQSPHILRETVVRSLFGNNLQRVSNYLFLYGGSMMVRIRVTYVRYLSGTDETRVEQTAMYACHRGYVHRYVHIHTWQLSQNY